MRARSRPLRLVAVVGSGSADATLRDQAYSVGGVVARLGFGLVCGGLGGVMEAACHGAHDQLGAGSGRIIGILPGSDPRDANRWVDAAIASSRSRMCPRSTSGYRQCCRS